MADEVRLRFYEELNDYLPPENRKREFGYTLDRPVGVGEALQELKVPASEVEIVLVNGSSVGFSHFLSAGDRVSIYPVFESFDIKPLLRIREEPLRQIRFMAGRGLDRLASYLRRLGFDVFESDCVDLAEAEKRILLTQDAGLLEARCSRVCLIRETEPKEQLKEVLARLDL